MQEMPFMCILVVCDLGEAGEQKEEEEKKQRNSIMYRSYSLDYLYGKLTCNLNI